MKLNFRCNGRLYNQHYAWIPTQVTSGAWVWFSVYYAYETKRHGWITLSPFEFLLDSSRDE